MMSSWLCLQPPSLSQDLLRSAVRYLVLPADLSQDHYPLQCCLGQQLALATAQPVSSPGHLIAPAPWPPQALGWHQVSELKLLAQGHRFQAVALPPWLWRVLVSRALELDLCLADLAAVSRVCWVVAAEALLAAPPQQHLQPRLRSDPVLRKQAKPLQQTGRTARRGILNCLNLQPA